MININLIASVVLLEKDQQCYSVYGSAAIIKSNIIHFKMHAKCRPIMIQYAQHAYACVCNINEQCGI